MKTRIIAIFTTVVLIITVLCGCSATIDTGSTNDRNYKNYKFWEQENQLRLVTNFTVKDTFEDDFQDEISEIGEKELTEKEKQHIKKLQSGIIKFFKEFYNIDLTEKLSHQEIRIFNSQQTENMTMGYVSDKEPNILNLNELIFENNDYSNLFSNTYIHETLHQLGIRDMDADSMLIEGIADAYADIILTYIGEWSYTTDVYFEARTLAYQIISVDEELPHLFLETDNFSLSDRINERLKNVPQKHVKVKNPGNQLVRILSILYSNNLGMLVCNTDPYYYAYDAQEIVRAYCQTFNPNHERINYIRSHYLLGDYEELEILKDKKGRYSFKE